jgi:outer membrane protein assembly factor BamA
MPYPTLAEEIEDMREEVGAKMNPGAASHAPDSMVSIEAIKIDGRNHLPARIMNELITSLKHTEFNANSNWLDEIEEMWIRRVWQDNGFFKVEVTAESQLIDGDFTHLYFSVTVRVDEGMQYRLGDVSFRSSDPDIPLAFPPERLRRLILLQAGDMFSADQIRKSLEALKKFYSAYGYIDLTPTPFADVDDSTKKFSLRFELEQQRQFRIGKVEVWGPNSEFESLLKSKLKPGDIFNYQAVVDFLSENTSTLPADVSPSDVEMRRSVKLGIVDLRFDFAKCPDPADCSPGAVKPCLRVDHSPETKTE